METIEDIKDSVSMLRFSDVEVGDKMEVYVPCAKELESNMNITFADSIGYTFIVTAKSNGMLWTNDIKYGYTRAAGNPPPPIEGLGSPFPPQIHKYLRKCTDG